MISFKGKKDYYLNNTQQMVLILCNSSSPTWLSGSVHVTDPTSRVRFTAAADRILHVLQITAWLEELELASEFPLIMLLNFLFKILKQFFAVLVECRSFAFDVIAFRHRLVSAWLMTSVQEV